MKKMIARLALILVIGSSGASPWAFAGNEGAHGGDPYALEFINLGKLLSSDMITYQAEHPELFAKWKLVPSRFSEAVNTVRIVSDETDQVVLNGNEVDAINYPDQNKILVNRTRWREDSLRVKLELCLHEYFGILGVERDRYDASIDFASFITMETKKANEQLPGDELMANIFYGRCLSFPSLSSPSTCDVNSEKMNDAISCSKLQAESKCKLAGKKDCDLISTTFTPTLSTTTFGLRYCEVLTLMK